MAFSLRLFFFFVSTCNTCLEHFWGVQSAVLFHILYVPIPYSSGSCFLWFYPGGYAGCYEGLLVPDVLCQEEYDVHSDNFVLFLLGATWGHFSLLSNTLLHFCSFLIFLQLKRCISFAVFCVFYVLLLINVLLLYYLMRCIFLYTPLLNYKHKYHILLRITYC